MADKFHHETIYRGPEQVAKLVKQPLTICGAGALGFHVSGPLPSVDNGLRGDSSDILNLGAS